MENCRYTIQPIWKRLRLFSHNCFCNSAQSLRSNCRDVWRVRNPSREIGATRCRGAIKFFTRAKCDQDRSTFGLWWLGSQKIFCCNSMENELKSYHNKTNWATFCMDAGFLNVVEIGQYFMTKDTAEFSQFHAVACSEYTLPRDEGTSEPKGWIRGNTKIGHRVGKLQLVVCMVSTELRSELCLRTQTILTLGSEFLMDQTSLWWIWTTMNRKFQKFSSKNMR